MSANKRVLIVDDDHDIRRGAHFRLRAAGYETLQAENGRRGVDSAEESSPDAIVMDVRMPEVDGIEAMKQLRCMPRTRNIPVVIVSASPCEETSALEQGARYFLRKPYSASALVAAVNAVTDGSQNDTHQATVAKVTACGERQTALSGRV